MGFAKEHLAGRARFDRGRVSAGASRRATAAKTQHLVIMGDDIGYWNISAYNRGMMGYRITHRRIANEERSLPTTGSILYPRACGFHHRQVRCGLELLKVGYRQRRRVSERPDHCRSSEAQGYATGQFGKNHLGDRNEFLPTVHGFDEFFGNLYHLNAEDETGEPTIRNPNFRAQFGRAVCRSALPPRAIRPAKIPGWAPGANRM